MTSVSSPASRTIAWRLAEFVPGCRRQGEEHRSGAGAGGDPFEVVRIAFDREAADSVASHRRIVVDECHRSVVARADGQHRGDRPVPAVAGTQHDHRLAMAIVGGRNPLGTDSPQIPVAEHRAHRDRRRHDQYLARASFVGHDELGGDQDEPGCPAVTATAPASSKLKRRKRPLYSPVPRPMAYWAIMAIPASAWQRRLGRVVPRKWSRG